MQNIPMKQLMTTIECTDVAIKFPSAGPSETTGDTELESCTMTVPWCRKALKDHAVYVLLMLEMRLQERWLHLGLQMNPETLLGES